MTGFRAPTGMYFCYHLTAITKGDPEVKLRHPREHAYVVRFEEPITSDEISDAAALIAHARRMYDVLMDITTARQREEFQDVKADAIKLLKRIETYRLPRGNTAA